MGWGASGIDPAGKAVVIGAYAPALREVRRVRAAAPGLPFFFFARIVALLRAAGDNIIRNGGEEEVLSCKRGYVRLTWNKDSRYCVDGILCRTPEELFDLLLTDYQDYELLRRTKGRREVTEADEKAVEKLCQPYLDWRKGALK